MVKEAVCLHFLLLTSLIIWTNTCEIPEGHRDMIAGLGAARSVVQTSTQDVTINIVNKTLQLMKYHKQIQHEILTQEGSASTSYELNTTLNELNVTLTKVCHWIKNVTSFSFLSCNEDEFYSYLMEFMIFRKIKSDLWKIYKTLRKLQSHNNISQKTWLDERMSDFPNATYTVLKKISENLV